VTRRLPLACALSVGILGATLAPALGASATAPIRSFVVTGTLPASLTSTLPLLRLHFSFPTKAKRLPLLVTKPALATKWQQIGPNDVQAVLTGALRPAVNYRISLPTRMSCSTSCSFTSVATRVASMATNVTWEEQLLAELNYLPVSFTASNPSSSSTVPSAGTFTWKYSALPKTLQSQWKVGVAGAILRGAVMNFQSQHNLPTTGLADAAMWSDLLNDVTNNKPDASSYNYVYVSEGSPETATLYVGGKLKFRTLANTGISVSPTAVGTYPVYERFLSTTMSGTNPDGSHYADPDIQWVSYFNGGDALHEFPRYSYGSPQSLGCVEMPFASAQTIFPFTPIGTLVSVGS
jgi:peptidoglycan hydrolase-like protein with peptidoglycan-binding domain